MDLQVFISQYGYIFLCPFIHYVLHLFFPQSKYGIRHDSQHKKNEDEPKQSLKSLWNFIFQYLEQGITFSMLNADTSSVPISPVENALENEDNSDNYGEANAFMA